MDLDLRTNAFRADLADEMLRGKVEAGRFVPGSLHEIAEPLAPMRAEPRFDSRRTTELLFGERVKVFETSEGWAWVKAATDGYVGYIPASSLSGEISSPTHRIAVPSTFMYPAPDIKSAPEVALPLNARIEVIETGERFVRLRNGRFVIAAHAKPIAAHDDDFVAVAEMFLNAPYLWGGKTAAGLDCSGLLQTALQAAGRACPRDTDMQERELGTALNDRGAVRRGDLLFWRGHVGVMVDALSLLHANGHHMQVVVEPADTAIARIARSGTELTSVRRLQ
ncbi:MAG TPA: NlpC/P60 family protein [Allosphingosinicella sp.]|nr:NlpC/P60 family protein [Allosphingosinicella sp.]